MKGTRWLAVYFCIALSGSASALPLLRTIAVSGQQAPGTPSGAFFEDFQVPDINDWGQVAFQANLLSGSGGVSSNSDIGIWSDGGGALGLIAREGSQAPGTTSGAAFTGVQVSAIDDEGKVAVAATLQVGSGGVTSSNDHGAWIAGDSGLELILREGSQIPGLPAGTTFAAGTSFLSMVYSGAGKIAFDAAIQSMPGGIWSNGSGALQMIAQTGQVAPGTNGAIFAHMPIYAPISLSNQGSVSFIGLLAPTPDIVGLWAQSNGQLQVVAQTGMQAPGLPAGQEFGFFEHLNSNDSGEIAFVGHYYNASDDTFGEAIWTFADGTLTSVTKSGDQAPGFAPGTVFGSFIESRLKFNALGHTAFASFLSVDSGGATEGVFVEKDGFLEVVLRNDDPAPDAPGRIFYRADGVALNDRGQVAVHAWTNDGGDGIWAQDSVGHLRMIAMTGTVLEVGPGDQRTVLSASFSDFGGSNSGFNDRGQLAFRAEFTDGTSGIFVSNLVAVPEPSALVLLYLATVGLLSGRHR